MGWKIVKRTCTCCHASHKSKSVPKQVCGDQPRHDISCAFTCCNKLKGFQQVLGFFERQQKVRGSIVCHNNSIHRVVHNVLCSSEESIYLHCQESIPIVGMTSLAVDLVVD